MARVARKTGNLSQKTSFSEKIPNDLFQLEGIVGNFMEYWGFKKIHGRIWAHLYTSAVSLDSIQLMGRLKVSKGLMSLAIRDLIEYDVIRPDYVGRHGTTFYKANSDLMAVIANVLKKREMKMLEETKIAIENLQKQCPEILKLHKLDPEKIQNVMEMTVSAQFILQTFLNQEDESPYSFCHNLKSD